MRISRSLCCVFLTVLSISPITLPTAQAQQSEAGVIEEIVIIGSRRQDGRSQAESLVPVDVISGDDFMSQGSTGIDSQLANLVPSYNHRPAAHQRCGDPGAPGQAARVAAGFHPGAG